MNDRQFALRLTGRYTVPDNTLSELRVGHRDKGSWQPFALDSCTPGFLVCLYAIFTCQHLYMRSTCAERGLLLRSATGSDRLVTT